MTYEEIDERYRVAVLSGGGDSWDDPEKVDDDADDDGELGYRNPDEDASFDEAGDQQEARA
ncbi:MAG TPA: hypothetical protein VM266_01795 [Solirubrobacteraceae bacterium]|nr:hypothetical protein [Solirubrobacteraceae bacterium]